MAIKQLPLPGVIVKKSNALIRARWTAESIWEPRLVALLASKVREDDTDFHIYEIPVTELMEKTEKNASGKTYQEVTGVVDRIMGRVITIRDEVGRGWTKYNVFSRCRYRPDDGILELRFDPDLKPHYLNLQKNFAEWNLIEFLMLPSIYSQRLFEFLKSWDDKPETPLIPLDELHEMLNTPASFRANFGEFRRRVLEKAHKDITLKTTLSYEWEPIKKGRAVVAVRFIFAKKRALPVVTKKADDAREKQSQKNNADFLAATACLKERGLTCEGGHQKQVVCALCRNTVRPQQD
ncbi:MAG: replication initiation protein [Cloacibacillus sp.]